MNRVVDILVSVAVLPILILFVAILAVLILIFDKHYPFFIFERIGKNGTPFKCLKLRTLTPAKSREDYIDTTKIQQRITKFGRILRDHGWDELPQVLNIVLGDMCFIGPRPIREVDYTSFIERYPRYKKHILEWKKKRLKVRPGITGWHQIHLTDHTTIKYDTDYLNDPSLSKIIKIILVSFILVCIGKNRYFGERILDVYLYEIDSSK